jgi:predicted Zn-dependent protease
VDGYLNSLGRRLAEKAPGEKYPYQFKGVNDMSINAFALPGGFLYVNRGTIEAAENEAQLAGVMGHEIGHVALRHGTNQATKAYAWQLPLAAVGGVVGSNSLAGVLAQLGAGFAVNSVLLKYSRDAERQADLVGTQILYDNRYDPRAMAQFFEKIEAEGKGGRPPQFLSSHPNPENRMQSVLKETEKLGGLPANYKSDSAEFQEIKRYIRSLPPAPKGGSQRQPSRQEQGRLQKPPRPSDRLQTYSGELLQLSHPDNWRVYGQGHSQTLAPEGGIVGDQALGYGVIISVLSPARNGMDPAHSNPRQIN